MYPTPETLSRHELNGLPVRVLDAPNASLVGIAGRVVSETMQTLAIESSRDARVRTVPKHGTTFAFMLTDETAGQRPGGASLSTRRDREVPGITAEPTDDAAGVGGHDVTSVTVDGERLLSRPATRTETRGNSIWR